jgi:hypothetical protein
MWKPLCGQTGASSKSWQVKNWASTHPTLARASFAFSHARWRAVASRMPCTALIGALVLPHRIAPSLPTQATPPTSGPPRQLSILARPALPGKPSTSRRSLAAIGRPATADRPRLRVGAIQIAQHDRIAPARHFSAFMIEALVFAFAPYGVSSPQPAAPPPALLAPR